MLMKDRQFVEFLEDLSTCKNNISRGEDIEQYSIKGKVYKKYILLCLAVLSKGLLCSPYYYEYVEPRMSFLKRWTHRAHYILK